MACYIYRLELRDVVFRYPSRPEAVVFNKLNLTVEAGTTVALVGASGNGKSTVVSLLERFYDPESGAVLLDGRDIRELNVQWLRKTIGLVSQEPVLFSGTIADNIAYGKPGASMQEIIAAAKMANAHDFVTAFPDSYDTLVGDKGVQCSGGQKQRIAIARAILKDPTVLLLDEATSALDSESERIVQQALDALLTMRKRTTIVIAHRLSTIRGADVICVVQGGAVVEQGTHTELMAVHGGHYRLLVKHAIAG
jgi:ATP-binding cassette, subfamily B (MDR/TAP), member 1